MKKNIINVSPMEYSRLKYTLANDFESITLLEFINQKLPIEIKCQEEPNIFNSPEESFKQAVDNLIEILEKRNSPDFPIKFEFSVFSGEIFFVKEVNVVGLIIRYKKQKLINQFDLDLLKKQKKNIYSKMKKLLNHLIIEFVERNPELNSFITIGRIEF